MLKKNDLSNLILIKDKIRFILSLDRGNTRDKFSLYDRLSNKVLIENTYAENDLFQFNINSENTLVSLSNVSKRSFELPFRYVLSSKLLRTESELFNVKINYSESLGEDRLISSFYLFHQEKNGCCLLDSGTFTTIDFISQDEVQGGFILPGLTLLQDSYNQGANLEFKKLKKVLSTIPHTTDDAIAQGAYYSFLSPLFSILENFNVKKLVLTGAHANEIEIALQNHSNLKDLAIQNSPNLVLKALTHFAEGVLENANFTGR